MKAITLIPGTKNVSLKDYPEPQIKNPDEIKVKVLQVGICGTDREETSGGRADAPPGEKELIIGHEMLSRVIEVGKEVTHIKSNDLVVISVRRECNNCPACNVMRSDMCLTGNYTERGIKQRHGFQSEYVVDKAMYAIKVPESTKNIGVLAEPMSVVQKAIDQAGIIQTSRLPYDKNKETWLAKKTVLVAGLGPIGVLAAIALRLRGAEILGLDIVSETSPRVQILKKIGGTYINNREQNFATIQKKHSDIHLILDAAGVAKLDFSLIDLLGVNGIFVLTGVPGHQSIIEVDGASLMRNLVLKNQIILGSVNESLGHFASGIKDLEMAEKKWPGVVEMMITERFTPKDFMTAFTHHTQDEIKVIIDWEL